MSSSEPLSVTAEPSADGLRIARPASEVETTGVNPAVLAGEAYAPQSRVPAVLRLPLVRQMAAFLLFFLLLGALAGLVWNWAVDLPSYTVSTDGSMGASTTERGLADFFATDAWFSVLGAIVGLMAGAFAWRWFRRMGWPVVAVALVASSLAAAACWAIGSLLGPHDFDDRLAAASPGATVPIDFALRSFSAVLVWPLFAVVPVLVASLFTRDDDADRPRRPRRLPGTRRGATEARQVEQDKAIGAVAAAAERG